MWIGKPSRGQNLYCKEQQAVTDLYRNNYDAIQWDRDEKEETDNNVDSEDES